MNPKLLKSLSSTDEVLLANGQAMGLEAAIASGETFAIHPANESEYHALVLQCKDEEEAAKLGGRLFANYGLRNSRTRNVTRSGAEVHFVVVLLSEPITRYEGDRILGYLKKPFVPAYVPPGVGQSKSELPIDEEDVEVLEINRWGLHNVMEAAGLLDQDHEPVTEAVAVQEPEPVQKITEEPVGAPEAPVELEQYLTLGILHEMPEKFPSRSEWQFAAICTLVSAGLTNEQIDKVIHSTPVGDRYETKGNFPHDLAKARELVGSGHVEFVLNWAIAVEQLLLAEKPRLVKTVVPVATAIAEISIAAKTEQVSFSVRQLNEDALVSIPSVRNVLSLLAEKNLLKIVSNGGAKQATTYKLVFPDDYNFCTRGESQDDGFCTRGSNNSTDFCTREDDNFYTLEGNDSTNSFTREGKERYNFCTTDSTYFCTLVSHHSSILKKCISVQNSVSSFFAEENYVTQDNSLAAKKRSVLFSSENLGFNCEVLLPLISVEPKSVRDFAEECNLSIRQIRDGLNLLVSKNLVTRHKVGRAYVYHLEQPATLGSAELSAFDTRAKYVKQNQEARERFANWKPDSAPQDAAPDARGDWWHLRPFFPGVAIPFCKDWERRLERKIDPSELNLMKTFIADLAGAK